MTIKKHLAAAALAVVCPKCSAEVGKPCRAAYTNPATVRGVHSARAAAARQAAER